MEHMETFEEFKKKAEAKYLHLQPPLRPDQALSGDWAAVLKLLLSRPVKPVPWDRAFERG